MSSSSRRRHLAVVHIFASALSVITFASNFNFCSRVGPFKVGISKLIITLTLGAPVDGSPERPTRPSFRYPPVSGTHAPTFVPNMGVHVRYADPPSPESSQIWVSTSVTRTPPHQNRPKPMSVTQVELSFRDTRTDRPTRPSFRDTRTDRPMSVTQVEFPGLTD